MSENTTARDERLREAREFTEEARVSGFDYVDTEFALALDDEIIRLSALLAERDTQVQRVRDGLIEAMYDALDRHGPTDLGYDDTRALAVRLADTALERGAS